MMHARFVFGMVLAVVILGAAAAQAAVTVLGEASVSNQSNTNEFTLSVTVPAGTELAVAGVTNRNDRAVSWVRFDPSSNFHKITDSEASGMDERGCLLYFKNPPAGAQTIRVRMSDTTSHKAVGVVFLSNIDLTKFSDAGAATPLLPLSKIDGADSGDRDTSSLVFSGTEAPAGSLVVSTTTCRGNNSLTIQNTPAHIQKWNLQTTWGGFLEYQRHGGSVIAGSASDTTVSWKYNGNWGLAAASIPPRRGLQDITATALAVGDNAPANTTVGTLTAVDPDNLSPYTWTLVDNAGGRFSLAASTSNTVTVKNTNPALLDAGVAAAHTIRVRVADAYGNTQEKDFTVTVTDTTNPVIGVVSPAPATVRDGAVVSITVPITDNAGVAFPPVMTVNGETLADPSQAGNDYTWAWTVPAGTAEGFAAISVSAADTAGNPAAAASNSVLLIDNTPPAQANLAVSDGVAKPGDTVVISIDITDANGVVQWPVLMVGTENAGVPTVAGDTYSWAHTLPADTPEGYALLAVTALDAAGNSRLGVAGDMLLVDATPPSIASITSSVEWATTGTEVTVSAFVSDNFGLDGDPSFRLNGNLLGAPQVAGNQYSWTFNVSPAEQQGPAVLTVDARDNAGNTSSLTPSVTLLTIDRTLPAINLLTAAPALARVGTTVTFGAQVLDNYGLSGPPALAVNGFAAPPPTHSGSQYTWVMTIPAGVAEGPASVQVIAGDIAGNQRTLSSASVLTLDPNGPVFSGVTATPAMGRASTAIVIKAVITDLSGVSGSPSLKVNGVSAVYAGLSGGLHAWNYTIGGAAAEGMAEFLFSANDPLGNNGAATVSGALMIDRTVPAIAAIQASPNVAKAGDIVRVSFTATDALTGVFGNPSVSVNGNSATFQSNTGSQYEYRYTVRTTDADGYANILVSARDTVGNGGIQTSSTALLVDNTVPTVSAMNAYPAFAKDNTAVTVGFRVNDVNGLASLPEVTVNGRAAAYSASEDGYFEYTHTVRKGTDPEGPAVIQVRCTDMTGNTGTSMGNSLLFVDTVAPSGAVVIDGNAAFTRLTSVTLSLSHSDGNPGSGVAEMSLSDDGVNWLPWEPAAAAREWQLVPGQGYKKVYARFRDNTGNVSPLPFSDTIALNPYPLAVDQESPAGVLARRGSATVLEVSARNVFGNVTSYEWRRNGESLLTVLGPGKADGPTLALENMDEADGGRYTCVVTDELETRESAGFLVVVQAALPAAGTLGLAAMALAAALLGAGRLRGRK